MAPSLARVNVDEQPKCTTSPQTRACLFRTCMCMYICVCVCVCMYMCVCVFASSTAPSRRLCSRERRKTAVAGRVQSHRHRPLRIPGSLPAAAHLRCTAIASPALLLARSCSPTFPLSPPLHPLLCALGRPCLCLCLCVVCGLVVLQKHRDYQMRVLGTAPQYTADAARQNPLLLPEADGTVIVQSVSAPTSTLLLLALRRTASVAFKITPYTHAPVHTSPCAGLNALAFLSTL